MEKPLSESIIKKLFYEALLAISHMHSKGICHWDIKPENFILYGGSSQKSLKIVDFGLAKQFIQENKRVKFFWLCGTPAYVAPDVLTGDYDERCDIWSAGVMLYVMFIR